MPYRTMTTDPLAALPPGADPGPLGRFANSLGVAWADGCRPESAVVGAETYQAIYGDIYASLIASGSVPTSHVIKDGYVGDLFGIKVFIDPSKAEHIEFVDENDPREAHFKAAVLYAKTAEAAEAAEAAKDMA